MSDVTYHLHDERGVKRVICVGHGIERPLPRKAILLDILEDWDWGNDSVGTLRLAIDLLADALRFRHLASLAAPDFAHCVLSHLQGNCVLSRKAVRDWFFRSVRFGVGTEQSNGEGHSNGFLIV